jgi:hypothetical protein
VALLTYRVVKVDHRYKSIKAALVGELFKLEDQRFLSAQLELLMLRGALGLLELVAHLALRKE